MAKPDQFSSVRSQRINRYFSDSFKKKKVKELEQNLTTVVEISRTYEVSRSAVYKWLDKFSTMRKKGIRQVVEPASDTRKLKELKERIIQLERLVGQKQIQLEFSQKMIELAEQKYGIDIKKNAGSPLSNGSGAIKALTGGK